MIESSSARVPSLKPFSLQSNVILSLPVCLLSSYLLLITSPFLGLLLSQLDSLCFPSWSWSSSYSPHVTCSSHSHHFKFLLSSWLLSYYPTPLLCRPLGQDLSSLLRFSTQIDFNPFQILSFRTPPAFLRLCLPHCYSLDDLLSHPSEKLARHLQSITS